MPKTIKLKEDLRWLETRYKLLAWLLKIGMRFMPFWFCYKPQLDGKILTLPKWITQRQREALDKRVEELMTNLKFD